MSVGNERMSRTPIRVRPVVAKGLKSLPSVKAESMAALVPAIAGVAALMMHAKNASSDVEYKRATVDGQYYLVLKRKDSSAAANLLAMLRADMHSLVTQFRTENATDEDAGRLVEKFDGSQTSEGDPDTAYTSYTVHKARIVLCLRQKGGAFVPKNVIMYVAIHELAHIMTPQLGHKPEFWENNRRLLKCAEKMGVYLPHDFANAPQPYCGIHITS
jgi:hypothetical protein